MQCPKCSHVASEQSAKFCSECGFKLPKLLDDKTSGVPQSPAGHGPVDSEPGSLDRQPDNHSLNQPSEPGSLGHQPDNHSLNQPSEPGSLGRQPDNHSLNQPSEPGSLGHQPDNHSLNQPSEPGSLGHQPDNHSLNQPSEVKMDCEPGSLGRQPDNVSPKRPSEDLQDNIKKKRKKRKNKKKTNEKQALDSGKQEEGNGDDCLTHTLSEISLAEKQNDLQEGAEFSSFESTISTMDEAPDSLQESSGPPELQGEGSIEPGEPSVLDRVNANQTLPSESPDTPMEVSGSERNRTENASQDVGESSGPEDTQRPTYKTALVASPSGHGGPEEASRKGPEDGAPKTDPKKQRPDGESNKGAKDAANSQKSNVDQNANVEQRQTRQKTKGSQPSQEKKSPSAKEGMVFGPQSRPEALSRTRGDQKAKTEQLQVQQSANSRGDSSPASRTPGSKKGPSDNGSTEKEKGAGKQEVTPPERKLQEIPLKERLTIHFHAVLSKDFKLEMDDRVFLRAGSRIGTWEENATELYLTRDLGEHGFYVHGQLVTTKTSAASVSIPYKYVVYKAKKNVLEYEYIYKTDVTEIVNRCLFVKPHLLSEEGEWHQFDDIVCVQPSKGVLKRLKETIWPQERMGIIQGREIAGKVMLETIFGHLSRWSDVNIKTFLTQLHQFHQIYANPYVYEGREKKWNALGYGEKEVNGLLKEFMLEKVIPQPKDGDGKGLLEEPFKAAIISLYVYLKYKIKVDKELTRFCNALCLPKLLKAEFLQFWDDFSKSFSVLKGLSDAVEALILAVKNVSMPRWILLLPLLHFLKQSSAPFEPVLLEVNPKYDLSWAGLQGLKFENTKYLTSQDRRAMLNLMKAHNHLVEVDQLLSRSWMFLVTLEDLVECSSILPVDLLDILHVMVGKMPAEISYSNCSVVSEVLSHFQKNLIEHQYSGYNEGYGEKCLAVSIKLLEKICRSVRPPSYSQNFTQIPVTCMNLVVSVSGFARSSEARVAEGVGGDKLNEKAELLLSEAMKTTRSWISQTYRGRLLSSGYLSVSLTSEIDMWNDVISLDFGSKEFTKKWRQTFTTDLEGKLKNEPSLDQIQIYCSKIEELNRSHPHVGKSVEKCAIQAIGSICQSKSESKVFEIIKINFWKFGRLVSEMILKSWPKDPRGQYLDGEEVALRHLLNWSAAKNIFQLLGTDEKLIERLTDDANEKIALASSAFDSFLSWFISGKIPIKLLNHILEKKNTFMELLKIDYLCDDKRYKDGQAMKRLVEWRQEEVKAVYHEKELVGSLLTMCQKLQEHLTVESGDLEERYQTDIESKNLDQLMLVHQLDEISSAMSDEVTFFNLDEDTRQMAEVLHTFKDSYIFKMCWENQAKEHIDDENEGEGGEDKEPPATLAVIHKDIFQPSYSRFKMIYTSLKDGTLSLQEVDVVFEAYKGKYEELKEDLDIMCRTDLSDNKRWIQKRIQQIEQYHELHLAVESAQVIMKVKLTLSLQGDFKIVDTLLEVTHVDFKRECLDRIDNDLVQAKKVLVDITKARRQCLQELGFRKNFILWVKEALVDINELKVFVDLASISAGENDLDVDRVACFHDAVLGYSSMLYDLKPDAGFVDFEKALKKLWKALENDHNLPKKLRDTARHLEWLKTVKDSHGSVELSSLSLASAINKNGIYIIGAHGDKKLTLDTALKLQIPEEHDDGQEMRSYSLEDLRELQNKLMLMSGKGDQGQGEVDRFAEIFDSAQRLAAVFIDLFTAGNPLFRHWEANVNCSLFSEAGIIMDFNLGGIIGEIMVEGSVVEQLPKLCRKMETCLSFWKDFMDKQRSQHYYLNYYTAEQIVYLCQKLIQKNVNEKLEDQVLMMLSFLKPDCKASDLRQTWHQLQYEILNKKPEQNEEIAFQTFELTESMEITENLGSDDCFEDLPSLVEQASGSGKLDLVWNAYMKDMTHFLPDSLDIGSLGRLLEILANKEEDIDAEKKRTVCRTLPKGFSSGRPNLIICPNAEILTSCICIYMSSEDEQLPTYDEVLLCSSTTTYEQVELFFRRCLTPGYKGEKIYTMLYADCLAYEVSYKVEQLFQQLERQSRKDYRLVIVCNSEREHTYLPSAFSQFRLHMVPQEPLDKIRRYLSKHYTVPLDESSAAAVFKGRQFVAVVSSSRAGVGKSLYIQRLYEELKKTSKKQSLLKCFRLIDPGVDENAILQSLLNCPEKDLTIFHFDITSSVQKGLHEFLFKLLVLHYLMDSEGLMWKCSSKHLYVIETLQSTGNWVRNGPKAGTNPPIAFLEMFPNIFCQTPKEVLETEMRMQDYPSMEEFEDPLMDDQEFRSEAFQRPYQYIRRFHNGESLDDFMYAGVEGTHVECLQLLFLYCGIVDPSWAELRNFAWFLNLQLRDCESSVFCNVALVGDTLQGFKNFVVDFMILMAKDFATPSLSISDQSPGKQQAHMVGVNEEDLAPFRIRKRWELEPHPYIFFNADHTSMTFIGFHLQVNGQEGVDAIDPLNGTVIRRNIMTKELYEGLRLQRVPFNFDFDQLPRGEKIERLCNVLGIQWPLDPDETYELTTDNMLKILAIHMRFRCGIPVIIMGETGCGKTRLIKFMCELQRCGVPTENMKLVKVHGGTSSDMIYGKVRDAEAIAFSNKQEYGFDSVLFFDEANTTEAISSIKEVLCDSSVAGERLSANTGLKIIAACNPYRKHTDEMIRRLESAGLGYRVRAEDTDEKLGSIPLRQLVYRVQALPPSMIPLVWDFGQLNDHTEKIYIEQVVQRVVKNSLIDQSYVKVITEVLASSQKYMRTRNDECSFVSLRDVERCMQAFVWFHNNHNMLLTELQIFLERNLKDGKSGGNQRLTDERDPVLWSLIMAVGVCYHACLEKKDKYRRKICQKLHSYNPQKMMQEISLMQDLLLSGVPLGETIARNNALKENVFMMVICIELRIPLFLVGKPGSSKSLSKTLVADAMQGQAAHSELYKKLKQIHLVSFQCSPHSTPEGIINTFKQCARFQEGKNLSEYISVVVLDEIGLAEDSLKMPLKTLHPLLEEGCIDDEPLPHKKVGFIGISNWALDPAKMNRGIFVSRGDPDEKELIESAKGICSSDKMILEKVRDFFQPFARAYLNIGRRQGKGFFGLRDYYSLIKMVFAITRASEQKPTANQIVEVVLRNFSGRDDVDAVTVFTDRLQIRPNLETISAIELVRQNISAIGQDDECRYLLVLTKNYAALQILQQMFFSDCCHPEIIFGSSFPKDQEYTQICRNINRVKVCMETGQTIVLLNLQNLYESLYDALNQYYVCLGGQKYVDLGLGTHRVKCRVHKDFRLIVIEEKEVVYKQFPIPLINRLEKHYLDINTVLKLEQKEIVKELERWVGLFVTVLKHTMAPVTYKYLPADIFVGYHSDTCASVVLQVTERLKGGPEGTEAVRKVLDEAKLILLNCATPDSVVRLDWTGLPKVEIDQLARIYCEEQKHDSLADFILSHTRLEERRHNSFTEVTTFSRLLTASDIGQLQGAAGATELLSLQQFDTEHSFLKKIRQFLDSACGDKILIIQTEFDNGNLSTNLIASAKYSAINEINKSKEEEMKGKVFVYFITKLPRIEGGTSYVGFHGGPWRSVHIDDLRKSKDIVSDIKALRNLTISQLFEEVEKPEAMEVEDMYTEGERPEGERPEGERPEGERLEGERPEGEQTEGERPELTDWESVLDTTALVRSCVQSAVGMLKDQTEDGIRSARRVEILLTLLADGEELRGVFLKIVKKRLHSLLSTHDGYTLSPNSWVFKEASNIDALQEGGTFRHTLWKRVQAVVIPFLAQVVSVIDRDRNLDLLLDNNSGECVKNLWLDVFGNEKLLEIPYTRLDRNSQTATILVQNFVGLDKNLGCSMPFSWRVKDYLQELWVHALEREGHTLKQFEEFFWKTPLGRYIADTSEEMRREFFQRYLQDFVSMTMKVTSAGELQLLCRALTCCVNELRARHKVAEAEVASLPWVHAAYQEFKNRLQNFSRMITLEPQVSLALQDNVPGGQEPELVLDVYAAIACLEHLELAWNTPALDKDGGRLAWLRRVKRLQVPVELVFSEENAERCGERSREMIRRVRSGWNRIFSLSLFVEHMLVGIEGLQDKLKPLVLENTRKLAQVLERDSDLKTEKPFLAVVNILKACKDAVNELIFRFGFQHCPVCLGEPSDPLNLPCKHIFCLRCIKQWLIPGQMYCPLCMHEIDEGFELKVSEDIRMLFALNARFRKKCNSFFIDLVSTVCFKDNSPPSGAIILHLLSLLMVEANPNQIHRGSARILTKALSPFDESVDKNPVVRSVVLKLLLKYSFQHVKAYLQQHLAEIERSNLLEEKDKTGVYSLYVNCLEDSMFERTQFRSDAERRVRLRDESGFLQDFLRSDAASLAAVPTVECLQQVARVRLCLDLAAVLLGESAGLAPATHEEAQDFLGCVVELCQSTGNDWYRVYLIRKVCSQKGVEFVQKMLSLAPVKWLFPAEILLQNECSGQMDPFLVCGEDYKAVRDAVAKAMIEGKISEMDEIFVKCRIPPGKKTGHLLLTIFREVTALYREPNLGLHPKPQQLDALDASIEASQVLGRPEVRAFASALARNRMAGLQVRREATGEEQVVVELAVHLAAVLLCADNAVLAPLRLLAMSPARMQRAFLPTMPDDMLAVAQHALGPLQWYVCPNGHPCAIGECGQPMERSRCVDCGADIGGIDHRPVHGFANTHIQGDRTQTGHVLGDPRRRDNPDTQDTKNMSPAPFTLVRLVTHLAMLLGASSNPQDIMQVIQPPVQDPGAFLLAHALKDLEQLTRVLGKGADDTACVVHLLLSSLWEPHPPRQWPLPYDDVLSTKDARNGWETVVANDIVTPQLKLLERRLMEVKAFIRADQRVSSNPVVKVTFGDPRLYLSSLSRDSLIHGPAVWSCRERVSLPSLAHIVEQNDGRDTLPVLWRFLQKDAELRLVKFLPDILTLQRELVKRFQNVTDLTHCTIQGFLQQLKGAALKSWYERKIKVFLTTWNQLRASLATNGELKIPVKFCSEDLDLSGDLQVLLPRRQDLGLCATALVSYLIALHNEMVYTVDKHTGEETSYSVSPVDLTDLHVIRYELERDLMPLVLSNCQYSMECGQETLLEYDLPKIQQQILARFLQGKPLIALTGLPTLVNRHDRNYENILKDVKAKVAQEPLPTLTLTALAGDLPSYSDVCEALSVAEVALGFLAMTGGAAHQLLVCYLEDVLQMKDQTAPQILQALSRCCLKHCVALWQFLASLKSESMLRLNRDPFEGVKEEYKEPLDEEGRRLLIGFLTKGGVDAWLLETHELLLLGLRKPSATDTYNPVWSLRDTLVSYMESKDVDAPPDVMELFPEEIVLSQFVEAWKFAVAFKQERGQR